jgi:hypothetical protein
MTMRRRTIVLLVALAVTAAAQWACPASAWEVLTRHPRDVDGGAR